MNSSLTFSGIVDNDDATAVLFKRNMPNVNQQLIDRLWAKACLNDLDSFKAIHTELYPLLFRYAYFIAKDKVLADNILMNGFVDLWNNRSVITANRIMINVIKSIRKEMVSYFSCMSADGIEWMHGEIEPPVILLSVYNRLSFSEREIIFLTDYCKLSPAFISEVLYN